MFSIFPHFLCCDSSPTFSLSTQLYRSYDTRLRCTSRSPNLYLPSSGDDAVVGFHCFDDAPSPNEAAKIVLSLPAGAHENEYHPFESPRPEDVDEFDWIWSPRGRLLLLSVPFREGRHAAGTFGHFIPVLQHLNYLHEHGRVHGDIRAFNIVFKDEQKGWLIDFDYGGKAGVARYPANFNFTILKDGKRIEADRGKIDKFHDYYALWHLMYSIHDSQRSKRAISEKDGRAELQTDLDSLHEHCQEAAENGTTESYQLGYSRMKKAWPRFLKKWAKVELKLDLNFSTALKKQEGHEGVGRRVQIKEEEPPQQQEDSSRRKHRTNGDVATGSFWKNER